MSKAAIRISPFGSFDLPGLEGTLLNPEYWPFRPYDSSRQDQISGDIFHPEISIVRYPVEILAKKESFCPAESSSSAVEIPFSLPTITASRT